jgi:hypothetical protein
MPTFLKYHHLKTWPVYFQAVVTGEKTFEIRKDDRDFKVGDILMLHEWDPETKEYTGRSTRKRVTYIAHGGLVPEGMVVMSIKPEEA